eukprot:scpid42497/ scgid25028/ 
MRTSLQSSHSGVSHPFILHVQHSDDGAVSHPFIRLSYGFGSELVQLRTELDDNVKGCKILKASKTVVVVQELELELDLHLHLYCIFNHCVSFARERGLSINCQELELDKLKTIICSVLSFFVNIISDQWIYYGSAAKCFR